MDGEFFRTPFWCGVVTEFMDRVALAWDDFQRGGAGQHLDHHAGVMRAISLLTQGNPPDHQRRPARTGAPGFGRWMVVSGWRFMSCINRSTSDVSGGGCHSTPAVPRPVRLNPVAAIGTGSVHGSVKTISNQCVDVLAIGEPMLSVQEVC
jgi:hypothetical protein